MTKRFGEGPPGEAEHEEEMRHLMEEILLLNEELEVAMQTKQLTEEEKNQLHEPIRTMVMNAVFSTDPEELRKITKTIRATIDLLGHQQKNLQ